MSGLTAHELGKYVGLYLQITQGDAKPSYPLQHDTDGFFLLIDQIWTPQGLGKNYGESPFRYELTPGDIERIYLNMGGQLVSGIELPSDPKAAASSDL